MEPYLEDPVALGKYDECEWCGEDRRECPCGKPDPDEAYDRSREEF